MHYHLQTFHHADVSISSKRLHSLAELLACLEALSLLKVRLVPLSQSIFLSDTALVYLGE